MRSITNTRCALYETVYCDLLNMQACENCFVNGAKDYEPILRDLDVLLNLLPEEPPHTLFAGEECCLCKTEQKGKRAYYALADMAHPEPVRSKRSVIGMKVKTQVGSLLPLQVGACKKCRNRMLALEYLPVLLPLGFGMLSLLLLMIPAIGEGLARLNRAFPLMLFASMTLIALLAGMIARRRLHAAYDSVMYCNVLELPYVQKLIARGWFPLNKNGNTVRVIFTKNRMRNGVCTGTPADANAKENKPVPKAEPKQPYVPQHGELNKSAEE